ncbi:putative microsomal epoxide hydrolase [Rosellinia necatrix]|uniref:Putative microsomal epoxide hydrolase n=1 Tax=Rosellinia necatrix TaxID=77044 RepID=A0A1S8AA34_ROSNE|nr:putative microsomal epoxide hydrolase [Rosellinia necatrix]
MPVVSWSQHEFIFAYCSAARRKADIDHTRDGRVEGAGAGLAVPPLCAGGSMIVVAFMKIRGYSWRKSREMLPGMALRLWMWWMSSAPKPSRPAKAMNCGNLLKCASAADHPRCRVVASSVIVGPDTVAASQSIVGGRLAKVSFSGSLSGLASDTLILNDVTLPMLAEVRSSWRNTSIELCFSPRRNGDERLPLIDRYHKNAVVLYTLSFRLGIVRHVLHA